MKKFKKKEVLYITPFFKNHGSGKMMENGCIANICFLSFKELFHFQEVQLPP